MKEGMELRNVEVVTNLYEYKVRLVLMKHFECLPHILKCLVVVSRVLCKIDEIEKRSTSYNASPGEFAY